jgi:hypothetical protein
VSSVANLISTEVFNVAFHPILPSIICSGSDDRAREPSRSLWFIAYLQAHDKVVSLWFKIAEFSCQKANPESHISSSFRKLNAGFCSIHVFWLNSNAAFTCAEGLTQIPRCFAMLRVVGDGYFAWVYFKTSAEAYIIPYFGVSNAMKSTVTAKNSSSWHHSPPKLGFNLRLHGGLHLNFLVPKHFGPSKRNLL